MDRTGKAQITEEVAKTLAAASVVVLTDFTGITVEEVTRLRRLIREKSGKFKVAKNTLVARAFAEASHEPFRKLLKGPNALAFAKDDPIGLLKVLTNFEKETNGKIKIKGGLLDGRVTTAAELKVIATLPPREVLLAQVAFMLATPIQRLLTVLNGPARKLVYALKALEEKKSKEAPAGGSAEASPDAPAEAPAVAAPEAPAEAPAVAAPEAPAASPAEAAPETPAS